LLVFFKETYISAKR